VRQADILGEVIVRAQAQPGDGIEIAVARSQEDDRQGRGQRAQLAAQREAAVHVGAEADIDQREVGKPRPHRGERFGARGVRRHLEAVLAQRLGVIGADGGLVFDDGDAA
jgi:hypothetical protein